MTTSPALLEAVGLTKSFSGTTVLHGVDLTVEAGESVSVMGPSGSGKSTLLYTISGLDTVSSGTVRFGGADLGSLSRKQLARLRLTGMGFVFQHVHLLKNLSLLDNVVLPAYLAGRSSRAELTARALALMERTGVADLAERDVSAASGGQLQRVGICRALVNSPAVLFADEPTGALDSAAATDIMDILCELNAEGTTLVIVTHDEGVAARTGRVLHMLDGRIVGDRAQRPRAAEPGTLTSTQTSRWSELGKGKTPVSLDSGSLSTGQKTPASVMRRFTLGRT